MVEQVDAVNAADRVADALRDRILEGALRPGSALREAVFSAELAVSRNTLREGLRLLAAEGLVEVTLNKGAAVRTLTAADVRDSYRARRAIEVQAATESAVADQEQFAVMEAAVVASERAAQVRSWRAAGTASMRFHQALVAVLGSYRLDAFFWSLLAQLRLAWAESRDEEWFQGGWAERDRELYELLHRGRRSEGVGALLSYLEDSERQVLDALRRARAGPRVRSDV
jgi:DNA-binding GntR family transcriptional regulator